MVNAEKASVDRQFLNNAMASFLQIGALLLLLAWCFSIIAPFIGIVSWALIIAVALYPAQQKLAGVLGGRIKLATAVLVLTGLSILLVPAILPMPGGHRLKH